MATYGPKPAPPNAVRRISSRLKRAACESARKADGLSWYLEEEFEVAEAVFMMEQFVSAADIKDNDVKCPQCESKTYVHW